MLCKHALLITIFTVLPANAQSGEQNAKDPLRGVWRLQSWEIEGKDADLPQNPPWIIIKKDKVLYGGGELGSFSTDSRTSPKIIDITLQNPTRTYEGIYAVERDTLKLCVNRQTDGVKERPMEFDTKDHPEWRLLTFQRDKDRDNSAEGLSGFVGVQISADERTKTVKINAVIKKSPAEKAGVRMDDKLLAVAGNQVGTLKEVIGLIQKAQPGTELRLRIERDGKERDVAIKVGVLPFFFFD